MNLLEQLRARRLEHEARVNELTAAAEQRMTSDDTSIEHRDGFTPDEDRELRTLLADTRELDNRIADLEAFANGTQRIAENGRRASSAVIRREERTYERWKRESFLLDMARVQTGRGDVSRARERLARHRDEIDVERRDGVIANLERSQQRTFERWVDEIRMTGGEVDVERRSMITRDVDRTDATSVGDFVPPIWMMELYADAPRAGRPFADRIRNIPLPPGTDLINVPKITTGTATAAQTADNAGVSEQDMVTNVAAAPVRTIAGQLDVALQVLEQSPVAFDEIAFIDLTNDYDQRFDMQLLNGSGVSGQIKGLLNASGITSVAYTDGSPTVPEIYPKLADAIQQAGTNRKLPPNLILGHLRRWMWIQAALDSQNRPLSVPTSPFGGGGPNNALAIEELIETGGIAGAMLGLPWLVDLNVPITLGGGSNQDPIVVLRTQDQISFEGALRSRVLTEVLSGTLAVRLQVYAYAAATFERYPAGISVVNGTGTVTPTF